jgi:hypothetical protein
MDRSFIRQQMQAKLEEFCFYTEKYIEELKKERNVMAPVLNESELEEYDEISQQIINFKYNNSEIIDELDIITVRLKLLYEEYVKKHNSKVSELRDKLTITHEGIEIIRRPLQYSTFAISLGYNEENQLMDVEFKGGKVYRYKKVPVDFYNKAIVKNSLRDLKNELNNFEFIQVK